MINDANVTLPSDHNFLLRIGMELPLQGLTRNIILNVQLLCTMPIGAGGLGIDSWASQIGHSVANGSPPLHELWSPGAEPRR